MITKRFFSYELRLVFTRFDFGPKFIFELELLIDGTSPERESQESGTSATGIDNDRVITR
jgi:hypothetical protein